MLKTHSDETEAYVNQVFSDLEELLIFFSQLKPQLE